jgi:hypothetical protein
LVVLGCHSLGFLNSLAKAASIFLGLMKNVACCSHFEIAGNVNVRQQKNRVFNNFFVEVLFFVNG